MGARLRRKAASNPAKSKRNPGPAMYAPQPINIHSIDHVVLRVVDLDSMIAFYCEVLGCRLERGPGEAGLAQLRAGHSLIDLVDANGEIGRQSGGAPDHSAQNLDHVCLQVRPWDADAIRNHLEKHGVEVGEIATRYGATGDGPSMYITDPEGNVLELKGSSGSM